MINSLKTLGCKWHEAKHKKAQKQNLLITNLNSNIKIIKQWVSEREFNHRGKTKLCFGIGLLKQIDAKKEKRKNANLWNTAEEQ